MTTKNFIYLKNSMDNQQQSTMGGASGDKGPSSFKMYTGKAPWPVQLVGGLMWLSGLGMIVTGIPMLLVFGLGIIPIVLGVFIIKYAKAVFRMEKKGYTAALVLQGLAVLMLVAQLFANGSEVRATSPEFLGSIAAAVLIVAILYGYRQRFTA